MIGNPAVRFFAGRDDDLTPGLGARLRCEKIGMRRVRGFSRSSLCDSGRMSMIGSRVLGRPSVASDGNERRVEAADNGILSLSAVSRNVERRKSRNESMSCLVDIAPTLARTILQ